MTPVLITLLVMLPTIASVTLVIMMMAQLYVLNALLSAKLALLHRLVLLALKRTTDSWLTVSAFAKQVSIRSYILMELSVVSLVTLVVPDAHSFLTSALIAMPAPIESLDMTHWAIRFVLACQDSMRTLTDSVLNPTATLILSAPTAKLCLANPSVSTVSLPPTVC